jgi:hypothetical protein
MEEGMVSRTGALAAIVVLSAGCYHATIETGLPPSNRKLEQHWAPGWIGGLVPPSMVETAERCPDGVARVETKLSFLNQLVGALTLGIYTPMYIEVTCAAAPRLDAEEESVPAARGASIEEKREVLQRAAELSASVGDAVLVRF